MAGATTSVARDGPTATSPTDDMELPNPNRIDLEDPAAVMLWADMLSITPDRLVEIVSKVGPMSAAVRFYATKLGTERGAGKSAPAPVARVDAFAEQAIA